ncbi:hypothetical protein EGW08_004712 [Elysia chlorotica]|uniref:Chitin-binding type-2 domain-containing protein n=1 Tax=Elysia chlorotica TaxID=188477 RepID=A0A3S1CAM6_ELYCH|nr:hypothetical protein EGW08_004712 [Elysia chlorotica]
MDVVPHPSDCDKYVQCYYNPSTDVDLAVVRSCPAGLFWLQSRKQCVPPQEAACLTDKCLEDCDAYQANGACGAYWKCNGRMSEFKCCAPMFSFKPGNGCQFDPTCQEECAPQSWCGLCLKKPNYAIPYGYDVMQVTATGIPALPSSNAVAQWTPRHCDYSYFDVVTCGCNIDIGATCPADRSFNFLDNSLIQQLAAGSVEGLRVKDMTPSASGLVLGPNSELHVNVNKRDLGAPFSIILGFSESQQFSPYGQVLLTSGMNCGDKRGLVVNADDRFISAQAYSQDGQKVVVSVPYQGMAVNEPKQLTISYANSVLTLSIAGRSHQYIAQSKAPVDICISCGIDVGAALNKQSIVSGQVQGIAVFSCALQSLYN